MRLRGAEILSLLSQPSGAGARDKERHNPILTKMDTMVMTQLPKRNKEMVTEKSTMRCSE